MLSTTEDQLRSLREGDRLTYHGVQWNVKDYSTYTDPNGYETEEWQLKSRTGQEYYLMREAEPKSTGTVVTWYLAEELKNPSIYDPSTSTEVSYRLADQMLAGETPYPSLQVFNRIYWFESKTEGTYQSEYGLRTRITWDYWDEPHLWNLALETWANGSLSVYSTRMVQPADFTEIRQGQPLQHRSASSQNLFSRFNRDQDHAREIKKVIAWGIMIVGFFLMIFGI